MQAKVQLRAGVRECVKPAWAMKPEVVERMPADGAR